MATTISSDSPLISLLRKHRSSALPSTSASGYTSHDLIHSSFPDIQYSEHEKEETSSWLSTSQHIGSFTEDTAKASERLSSLNTHLSTRTTVLGSKPSIADLGLYAQLAPLATKWSDEERTGEQGYHHIIRHLLFVQKSPRLGLNLSAPDALDISEDKVLVPIKPIDPKAEKERKKREKEAAAAAGEIPNTEQAHGRKAKKESKKSTGDAIASAVGSSVPLAQSSDGAQKDASAPANGSVGAPVNPIDGEPTSKKDKKKDKPPKAKKAPEPAKEMPLSPALIDLRVGHILKAVQHPNADSLYVSTIAVGDSAGTENTEEYEGQVCRTVCSGLNGLVPLEQMQNRKIVAVCNLKPVTMRGIKSAAMVLAASPKLKEGEEDSHAGPVELVEVPEGAVAGERINFEGWEGEPEGVLNPKKKIWETCQVGFTTTQTGKVAFEADKVEKLRENGEVKTCLLKTKSGGVCSVPTLAGATVR